MRNSTLLLLALSISLWSAAAEAAPVAPAAPTPPAKPADTAAPVLEHTPLLKTPPGKAVEITVQIQDASGVAFPRLYYRTTGTADFNQTTLVSRGGARFAAVIPAFAVTKSGVEYYLEAFDKLGNGPAYHGTRMKPHRITVRRPKTTPVAATRATPWYGRWWVWTIAGAVVAGSVAAVVVATSGSSSSSGPAATLVIEAPAPAPTSGLP